MDTPENTDPDHPLNRTAGLMPDEWEAIPDDVREAMRVAAWAAWNDAVYG